MTIDQLLEPIPGASPSGEDLSFSAEFDAINELRRQDDASLDQGEWQTALKVADWPEVLVQSSKLLATRSKDLRLAMWFGESSTITKGYTGLREGLDLCCELTERFWETLHPLPEDGDMEQRIGNISWFLQRVLPLVPTCALTTSKTGKFSLQDWQAAKSLDASIKSNPDKAAGLSPDTLTLDKFNRALKETPKDALRATLGELAQCQTSLAAWQTVVDAKLGDDGPSFVPVREALQAALHEAKRLAKDAGAIEEAGLAGASGGAEGAGGELNSAAQPSNAGGPLRNREQALRQLREVAAFFRATEPHSPVAYLADKAVHWGNMPLHEWLRTVVKDSGSLAHVEELLGLNAKAGDPS